MSRVFEDVSPRAERECRVAWYDRGKDEVFAYCILQRWIPTPILVAVYKPLLATFISTIEARSRCTVSVLSTRFPSYCAASQYADKGTPQGAERKCRYSL